ncbi:MAG: Gfo/Idh/MocA family oxidoreductase [Planctomycetes bacterium]|nr:Gfo/Idh/MocA family oxidoreductase [Planctomycetota bacterium]MBU4399123.1 Gfo/Idh/MocA family oxidoreductase [Planctomycetota bacterium]MCG2685034.1 Gfo/Idh/MocA family oxidoreductase [Planctomycetales bacterium]
MDKAATQTIGVIINGATGRMGTNQHLMRSIMAIIRQGGVKIGDDKVVIPNPILVGRNPAKLEELAARSGAARWTTDLDEALADRRNEIYFDTQTTDRRFDAVKKAIAAGKHVYCEKPSAATTAEALELHRLAQAAGVKNGVVQDKLWLPGMLKLKTLCDSGFFGRILSVRGEFGYWVFEGDTVPSQRPSWNYRKERGGGIILDMLSHFRYLLDNLFGNVQSVSCLGATHVERRWDENGKPYDCTADDSAYSTFELQGGVIAQINASWCVRVRRDDLLTFQVDGTKGTAVAGLRDCWAQAYGVTPRPVWNPDAEEPIDFGADWQRVPQHQTYDNAFKAQWELFLRHVAADGPFPWTLLEGAKGVQLAEKALESWGKRQWVDVPELNA